MCQMHMIIQFTLIFYYSISYSAPINSTISPDLNIIPDNHITILRYFMIYILICDKTKTITAYNCATVNDGIVTNIGAIVNMNIWKDVTIFSNTSFLPNYCVRTDIWIVTDYNSIFNNRECSNGYIFTNLSFWINVGILINTARILKFGCKLA